MTDATDRPSLRARVAVVPAVVWLPRMLAVVAAVAVGAACALRSCAGSRVRAALATAAVPAHIMHDEACAYQKPVRGKRPCEHVRNMRGRLAKPTTQSLRNMRVHKPPPAPSLIGIASSALLFLLLLLRTSRATQQDGTWPHRPHQHPADTPVIRGA